MKIPSVGVVFDRKNKATATKVGSIEIRVTFNRRTKYYNTGAHVAKPYWSDKRQVVKHKDSLLLNTQIDTIHNIIKEYITVSAAKRIDFSFSGLESFLLRKKSGESFIKFVKTTIKERRDITESTRKNHHRLISFLENKFDDIYTFSDLTRENIIKFDNELHKCGYKQTTIYTYHKFMKVYVNEALKRELIKKNPYSTLSFDKGKHDDRKFLTDEEIDAVRGVESSTEYLQKAKDVFLFQCNTGLAYAELENFNFSKVEKRDGRFILRDHRKKTGEGYYIVLLPEAMQILEKYDYTLPLVTNQKYNQYLKLIAGIAQLNKNLTSHMARHTFAVRAINKGIRIETISRMLGHSNIKTTQIYAKILDKTVESAFDKLI